MKLYWTLSNGEQEKLMNLVIQESIKRSQPYDNYNKQEVAFREAVSHGAMRHDEYYRTL